MDSNILEKDMRVIRLSFCHKEQVMDLMQKRYSDNTLSTYSAILDAYLDPNSQFPILFGVFQKKRLLSTLGLWKWTALPYATITYLLAQPSKGIFNPLTSGFNLCFNRMIKYGHENGILAYYLFRKKRRARFAYGNLPKELKKYFVYTEAIIPRNTRPRESIYWEIMDKEIKPFTGEIWRIMPKPKVLNSTYIAEE